MTIRDATRFRASRPRTAYTNCSSKAPSYPREAYTTGETDRIPTTAHHPGPKAIQRVVTAVADPEDVQGWCSVP